MPECRRLGPAASGIGGVSVTLIDFRPPTVRDKLSILKPPGGGVEWRSMATHKPDDLRALTNEQLELRLAELLANLEQHLSEARRRVDGALPDEVAPADAGAPRAQGD